MPGIWAVLLGALRLLGAIGLLGIWGADLSHITPICGSIGLLLPRAGLALTPQVIIGPQSRPFEIGGLINPNLVIRSRGASGFCIGFARGHFADKGSFL